MILKSDLLDIISIQQQQLAFQQSYPREMLPQLRFYNEMALIITGIRRCGKSTLLTQLLQQQNLQTTLFINFDTPRLFDFQFSDFRLLDEIIQEKQVKILFFDEIQVIDQWEIYVRGKLDEGYQVIVTGSNASLLSRELGTKLTGRHISKELFPFSFSEFCAFLQLPQNAESVEKYLHKGGFPQYLKTQENELFEHLINDILYRDIVVRYAIRDEQSMKRLVLFLASNVGNLISASKLTQSLNVKSTSTVQEYLTYLENAYLIQLIPKFAYSYKAQLVNPRKVYFIDNGLQEAISPSFTADLGRKLENAVFWALRRQYQEIYYYNENNKECDFVVCKNAQPQQLIQVCLTLNAENREREIQGVLDAMRFFDFDNGYIITLNQKDKVISDGKTIEIIPFAEFFVN
ncbi:ATP-binding protein [Mannheimia pernigra]|uniref:ATP-binding protein n=1 Tax=Mannheimia pernigra TaxID=111844 RepID=UPI00159F42EC|nr:ATP-binding protein [Mannheimia pernigra]QLB43916.1 ATP-binding protein [Mannheimia pernigra]